MPASARDFSPKNWSLNHGTHGTHGNEDTRKLGSFFVRFGFTVNVLKSLKPPHPPASSLTVAGKGKYNHFPFLSPLLFGTPRRRGWGMRSWGGNEHGDNSRPDICVDTSGADAKRYQLGASSHHHSAVPICTMQGRCLPNAPNISSH